METIKPQHGVITLAGYGLAIRVDRGHLVLEDGVGTERRQCRLARVNHGLQRLVVIGSDGMVSLSALQWLSDQDASFVMLDRNGKVLTMTGPASPSDVKLRRAQALALQNGAAFRISRELIDRKLAGQEQVASDKLHDDEAARAIRQFRSELAEAEDIDTIRLIEAQAARAYWSAWRTLSITFPRKDIPRVPEHWRAFGTRVSSLTGSPRLATNPVNAILNYLYALLEAEARLAAATLGLDPGIGVLHMDARYRDSLACDLMEPIRPHVDAFVLDWVKRDPLLRNSFFEQRDGNCRLMASMASQLSNTSPTWGRLVAPVAEWFAREIYAPKNASSPHLPDRLTQSRRRAAHGGETLPKRKPTPKPKKVCLECGKELRPDATSCSSCALPLSTERLIEAAHKGRIAAHSPDARAKRVATQRINMLGRRSWKPSDQPAWLSEKFYMEQIQPVLAPTPGLYIARAINVSHAYANQIRKGRLPHPRHWKALAELVGVVAMQH